jgi:hypothetical protein
MDPHYDGKPSMISETTFCRPNRLSLRSATLLRSLRRVSRTAIASFHFAFDGNRWAVKPNFWMQQWTLMTPRNDGPVPRRGAHLPARLGMPGPSARRRSSLNKT